MELYGGRIRKDDWEVQWIKYIYSAAQWDVSLNVSGRMQVVSRRPMCYTGFPDIVGAHSHARYARLLARNISTWDGQAVDDLNAVKTACRV